MAEEKKPGLTPEEVTDRLGARQEEYRKKAATKVTADDVKHNFDARKQARQAARAEKKRTGQGTNWVSIGVGIALLCGAGVTGVAVTNSTEEFQNAQSSNVQQIAFLEGQIDELPAGSEEQAVEYEETIQQQLTEATTKATEVAELQQEFAIILLEGDTASPGNGAPNPSVLEAVKHRKSLAPYFVADALLVDDDTAYAPGSVLPLEPTQIDPRYPWFVAPSGTWAVASVMPSTTPGILEVTWLNQNDSGDALYAWAQASYSVADAAFADLGVGTTSLGDAAVKAGGE